MEKTIIDSDKAPKAIGPYSQAVTAGNLLFSSGQLGIDTTTGKIVDTNIEAEARQVFRNVKNILEAGGSCLDNIIKATIYLTDLGHFQIINRIYQDLFSRNFPARSCVQVAALPAGGRIEMEVVAMMKGED